MGAIRSRLAAPLLVLLALLPGVLVGAPEDYVGRRITGIVFPDPDLPMPPEELRRLLPLRQGDVLTREAVRAAIERLHATGQFDDLVVEAAPDGGGVLLRILTEPNWFVSSVRVVGVPEPPNTGQLVNATKLLLGQLFAPEDLEAALENLHRVLRLNGFYEARITPVTERVASTQEVNIVFQVEPGRRARFAPPVVTGAPDLSASEAASAARWRRWWLLPGWREITERRVQDGLERIRDTYRRSERLMASVRLKEMRYDPRTSSAAPVIAIDAGPAIQIRVSGANISRAKLRELVPVYQEQSADTALLLEGRRNIAEYLQGRGYFDAEATYTVTEEAGGRRVIEYTVERGDRYKLVRLDITGNRYFDEQTIRERLYVQPATFLRFRNGRFNREYVERDREAIIALYQSNGFMDTQVTAEVVADYQGKSFQQAVTYRIDEGPQWFVSSFEMSGVDLKLYEDLLRRLTSTAGQPYSAFNVATDRDTILNFYFDNGYPDARLEVISNPDPQRRRVSLRYVVTEGPRQFVRGVLAGGLDATVPTLVTKRIRIEPGDPISQTAMVQSQRRLYDLGIFARVDVALQNPEGRTRSKYVLYQFEEARKYSLQAGVGAELARIGGSVTSFESPAGGAGFSPRVSLGISRSNFLGIGHTVGLQTRFSNLQQRALFTYLAPQFQGNEGINLSFTALWDDSRNVRTFSARRWEGAAQIGQRLSKANSMQYRIVYRRVGIDESTLKIEPQLIPLFSQPVRVGLVSSTFIQDRRDDPVEPGRGIYSSVDLGLATRALTSQTDFLRLLARNATYHSFRRDWVFARTLTFGWINNLSSRNIPLPERFFSGGATSHRGFPENQAGPRDPVTGFPVGGRAIFINQFEVRFPLLGENVGAVLFHDAGNVYSGIGKLSPRVRQRDLADFNYMVHAAGGGIRYRTPVGPIRVDLAYSINPPSFIGFKGTREELLEGRGQRGVRQRVSRFQFHFSLGQSF